MMHYPVYWAIKEATETITKGEIKAVPMEIWAPKAIMAMAAGQVLVVVMAVETAAVLEAEVALEMAVVAVEAMAAEEAIHLAIEKR
jgi:hypothetical protein